MLATKISMRHLLLVLGCVVLLLSPTVSTAEHDQIEVLSYDTGLSTEFLEKYDNATERLGIDPEEARQIIRTLSSQVKEFSPTSWAFQQLALDRAGHTFSTHLLDQVKQGKIEEAIIYLLDTMKLQSPSGRRSLAELFGIPVYVALINFDKTKYYTALELLSYVTGLSGQFLEDFIGAAESIGVGREQSIRIIWNLTDRLLQCFARGRTYKLLMTVGASDWSEQLDKLMNGGSAESAVRVVLNNISRGGPLMNPSARHFVAQTFGVPESAGLIYEKMQERGKSAESQEKGESSEADSHEEQRRRLREELIKRAEDARKRIESHDPPWQVPR